MLRILKKQNRYWKEPIMKHSIFGLLFSKIETLNDYFVGNLKSVKELERHSSQDTVLVF